MLPHRNRSPPPAYGAVTRHTEHASEWDDRKPSRFVSFGCLALFLSVFFLWRFSKSAWPVWTPEDPAEWQRQRLEHETDRQLWDGERRRWERERNEHLIEVDQWNREREQLRWDRAQFSNQWAAFKKQEYQLQQQLVTFNRDRLQLEKDKDIVSREKVAHELEKLDWGRDRALWARERDEWEQERRERHRGPYVYPLEAHWDRPRPIDQCHSYGKREYSARLWDIPFAWGWMEACEVTPVEIHGVEISHPDRCENRGFLGGVVGYWLVDFDEPLCEPYFDEKRDLGCINPGLNSHLRRHEAQVLGIQQGDDWEIMCSTTPTIIDEVEYNGPTYCVDKVHQKRKVAVWDHLDPSC